MNTHKINWQLLAYLTATASGIYIVESLLLRILPLPFIRLGLSNIIVLFLVWNNKLPEAVIVNASKSIIGSIVTFSLISPTLVLSFVAGLFAIISMWIAMFLRPKLSIIGVSIMGSVVHNLTQLVLVRLIIIPKNEVFVLTPILVFFGLISGIITACLTLYVSEKLPLLKAEDEKKTEQAEIR